jgi:excisionase family DNA binding protein
VDYNLDYCAVCGHLLQAVSERRHKEMLVGDLLTTKEAAELLRVSHWTVSAWLSQGKLPRTKAGGRTLIAKADLEAFLRRSSESEST